ncbi:MAG TPA: alpha/beta fold hydrolase [Actinomycetota bacterium]|nr:alpha/beta fold hydrolase [Actinomycetota bacterium]
MATARNGDVELSYEVAGAGPPLLLIAGWGQGSWAWYRQVPDLSRDYTVITFDHRGVGGSSKVTTTYTADDMAMDVDSVMEAAGAESAHVVGISLGGIVAMALASDRPERVLSLVVMASPFPGPGSVPYPEETLAAVLDPMPDLTPEQRLRKVLPYSLSPGWSEAHPDEFDDLLARRLSNLPDPASLVAQSTVAGRTDLTDRLRSITAPTLVCHGTQDQFVPCENAKLIADAIPGARVALCPGAGHVMGVEQPEWVNARIPEHCR